MDRIQLYDDPPTSTAENFSSVRVDVAHCEGARPSIRHILISKGHGSQLSAEGAGLKGDKKLRDAGLGMSHRHSLASNPLELVVHEPPLLSKGWSRQ